MSSSLCRVARLTVTPPIATGSNTANGFNCPVRLTLTGMSSSFVRACRARNLKAMAQRGSLPELPRRSCNAMSVDLDHDAVDVVVQLVALGLPSAAEREHLVDRGHRARLRVDRQAQRLEEREQVVLCLRRIGDALERADRIGKEREAPLGRHFGSSWRNPPAAVLRGFANIGRPAASRARLMRSKSLLRMYASPRTSISRIAVSRSARGSGESSGCWSYVLADRPVAARACRCEAAVPVDDRDGQAVDLQLALVGDGASGELRDACIERAQILFVERVS